MPIMLTEFLTSFILGLLTPLTAVCVLPLYPGFLSFLTSQFKGKEASKKDYVLFGTVITLGVLLFMTILGLVFTTILQASLTKIIGIISPIAFVLLGIISLALIFNFNIAKFMPKVNTPLGKNPLVSALTFGFFFGAIVIPCNPGFIAAFFARSLLIDNFASSMTHFILFGVGLGFPLLLFSLISGKWSTKIIQFLAKHNRKINLISGIIMLLVSLYYLSTVFEIINLGPIENVLSFLFSWVG